VARSRMGSSSAPKPPMLKSIHSARSATRTGRTRHVSRMPVNPASGPNASRTAPG
jgi:hypothetical protein